MSAIRRGDDNDEQTQQDLRTETAMEVLQPHTYTETLENVGLGPLKDSSDSELSSKENENKTAFERCDDESFDVEPGDHHCKEQADAEELGNRSPLLGDVNSLDLNLDSGFFSSSTPVIHCSTTRDNLPPKPLPVDGIKEGEIFSQLKKDVQNLGYDDNLSPRKDLFETCIENQDIDSSNSELFVTPAKDRETKHETKIPKCPVLSEKSDAVELSVSAITENLFSTVDTAGSEETSNDLADSNIHCELDSNLESYPTSNEILIDRIILTPDSQTDEDGFDETDQLIDESPLLSVDELRLKFESLHIFSQTFRDRKFLERSLSSQQEETTDIEESCEEASSSIRLLSKPCSAVVSVQNQSEDEPSCCELGLGLGSSLQGSLTISKSDLSLNNTPLVEEVTEIRSARLASIEDDNNISINRYEQSITLPRPSTSIMEEVDVNGDVGPHVNNSGPPALDDVTNNEVSPNVANIDGALPNTVHMISMGNNTKVYIVGTAHFSKESNEEVRQIIRRVRPSDVVVELCPARKDVLLRNFSERVDSTPKALSYQNIQAMIKQHKSTMVGIFYSLMLHVSVKVQKSTGLVAGGEFRAAYEECEAIEPMPKVHLGDRNVLVTLQRAWYSLSVWKQIFLIFTLLWSDIDITEEEIENCKEKDVLEMLLNELRQDFPELCNVILSERDLYLASSIRRVASKCEPNSAVVAVVGIGHMKGIVKNWECAQDADLQELCRIPRKQSRIPWKLLFRLSLLSGVAFFAYRYYRR